MLSRKPWNGYAVFRVCLGIFATWCLGNLIAGFLFQAKAIASEDTRHGLGLLISVLFFQGGVFLWIFYFLRENGLSWKRCFGYGGRGSGFAIGVGMLAGVLVVPITQELIMLSEWVMLHLNIQPTAQVVVQELQKPHGQNAQRTVIALLAVTTAPFIEETFFRGLLYPTIKQAGFPKLAFIGTSLGFAVLHMNYESGHTFISSLVTFVPLTFFAMVMILLYESTDNLLAPITAHAMFNFANFVLLTFQDFVNSGVPPSPVK